MEHATFNSASQSLLERAGVLGARHHLFVCIGPECCDARAGETLWEQIKARLKGAPVPLMRTKAACLRVCTGGPWLVVYPDGVWYGEMTPERFERIYQSHILNGVPVEPWVVATNPLRAPECPAGEHAASNAGAGLSA